MLTSYPGVQWGNTLDKREATDPRGNEENQARSKQRGIRREVNIRSGNNQGHRTTHAAGS